MLRILFAVDQGGVFTIPHTLPIHSGSPSMPRASPVSVYLFPGEGSKGLPSSERGDGDSELGGLIATATEVQAEMVFDEGSEGSTDNDDFCILEAPGMGIPVRLLYPDYLLFPPPHLKSACLHSLVCNSRKTGSRWSRCCPRCPSR